MLRMICLVTALVLLLGLSQISIGHQAVPTSKPVLVADGPDPMPPPLPLAQPLNLLADGPDPMPPPLPLAVPTSMAG